MQRNVYSLQRGPGNALSWLPPAAAEQREAVRCGQRRTGPVCRALLAAQAAGVAAENPEQGGSKERTVQSYRSRSLEGVLERCTNTSLSALS